MQVYGIFFGSSYLLVTILFCFVYYYLFKLLDHPVIRAAYPEYVQHKGHYRNLAIVSVVIYFIRSLVFMYMGRYENIISNAFVKVELFFAVTTLLELPFLF